MLLGLIPARHGALLVPDEAGVAVLGDDHQEDVGEGGGQTVGRAVAGAHTVGAFLDGALAFEVEGLSDGVDGFELAGDLPTEAQELEAAGHDYGAVNGGEAGDEGGGVEEGPGGAGGPPGPAAA